MPHIIGCIDGKYIRIECPKFTSTLSYNYCFTLVDLDQYGRNNNSGVLSNFKMNEMFDNNLLCVLE